MGPKGLSGVAKSGRVERERLEAWFQYLKQHFIRLGPLKPFKVLAVLQPFAFGTYHTLDAK